MHVELFCMYMISLLPWCAFKKATGFNLFIVLSSSDIVHLCKARRIKETAERCTYFVMNVCLETFVEVRQSEQVNIYNYTYGSDTSNFNCCRLAEF